MAHGITKLLLVGATVLMPMFLAPQSPPAKASTACVDVALVLAVDSSTSVSPGEYRLQQEGIAAAFRAPDVVDAMRQAGRVAVSVVFWGSETLAKPQSDWFVIADGADAEDFARTVGSMPRKVTGDTGLGAGLMASLAKLESLDICSVRKIINVSGDGEETRALRGKRRFAPPPQVRDLAESRNVEINALAISNEEKGLAQYFTSNVITGPDAFVMEAANYADFAQALQRKLIREISPRVVSDLAVRPATRTP